jgi:hypothetical protein
MTPATLTAAISGLAARLSIARTKQKDVRESRLLEPDNAPHLGEVAGL